MSLGAYTKGAEWWKRYFGVAMLCFVDVSHASMKGVELVVWSYNADENTTDAHECPESSLEISWLSGYKGRVWTGMMKVVD